MPDNIQQEKIKEFILKRINNDSLPFFCAKVGLPAPDFTERKRICFEIAQLTILLQTRDDISTLLAVCTPNSEFEGCLRIITKIPHWFPSIRDIVDLEPTCDKINQLIRAAENQNYSHQPQSDNIKSGFDWWNNSNDNDPDEPYEASSSFNKRI